MYNVELDAVIRKALSKQMSLIMHQDDYVNKLTYITNAKNKEGAAILQKVEVIQDLEISIRDYLQINHYKAATRKLYMLNLITQDLQQMLETWGR